MQSTSSDTLTGNAPFVLPSVAQTLSYVKHDPLRLMLAFNLLWVVHIYGAHLDDNTI